MKTPHLFAALLTGFLAVSLLFGGEQYASAEEAQYVHVLAPALAPQTLEGSALQRAAFCQPDLLPVLGASELLQFGPPYRASDFFQTYPTGFDVFIVAKPGATPLLMAQDLAAIGPDLRGKKVVITLVPLLFIHSQVTPEDYASIFSRLHADELAFSPTLSFELKRMAARRMLAYPDTLAQDPLLRFALEELADGSPLARALYLAAFPLGRLETLVIRLQDHWETLKLIQGQPGLDPQVQRRPATEDWQALAAQAEQAQAAASASNPYGVEDWIWFRNHKAWVDKNPPPGSGDSKFRRMILASQEWTDLDILLRTMKELGAQPLIVCLPANGPLWDALGVSYTTRKTLYGLLQAAVAPYGMPLVNYEDHDSDKYFVIDLFSHTSRKGWVYIDQTLDAFYHGALR